MWLRAPVGCLLERPATRRAQIKVRQELGRPVERSVVQRNDGHPAVVDLFPQHRDFLLQPVVLRLQSHAYVNTVSRLTAGGNGGLLGQGDHVQNGRANAGRPALRHRRIRPFPFARFALPFETQGSITALDHEVYAESNPAQKLLEHFTRFAFARGQSGESTSTEPRPRRTIPACGSATRRPRRTTGQTRSGPRSSSRPRVAAERRD